MKTPTGGMERREAVRRGRRRVGAHRLAGREPHVCRQGAPSALGRGRPATSSPGRATRGRAARCASCVPSWSCLASLLEESRHKSQRVIFRALWGALGSPPTPRVEGVPPASVTGRAVLPLRVVPESVYLGVPDGAVVVDDESGNYIPNYNSGLSTYSSPLQSSHLPAMYAAATGRTCVILAGSPSLYRSRTEPGTGATDPRQP